MMYAFSGVSDTHKTYHLHTIGMYYNVFSASLEGQPIMQHNFHFQQILCDNCTNLIAGAHKKKMAKQYL